MHSLSDAIPQAPRGSEAELRLVQAYKSVFSGRATPEDCDVVLADLAYNTGYLTPLGPGRSHDERAFADGRRWVMARVMGFLDMGGRRLNELHEAVLREQSVDHPVRRNESLDDYA